MLITEGILRACHRDCIEESHMNMVKVFDCLCENSETERICVVCTAHFFPPLAFNAVVFSKGK